MRGMLNLKKLLIAWCVFLVWPVMAADIQIQGNPGTVPAGQPFQLVFVVTGSQTGEPDFSPLREHFDLLSTSTSSQFSMINGRTSQSQQYQMTLAARKEGKVSIPGISFGNDTSPVIEIEVTKGVERPIPPDAEESGDELRVFATVDVGDPYVQQQVLLKVKIYRSIGWQNARLSDPRYEGGELLVHQLGQDLQYPAELDGKSYQVIERSYTLIPQQSGEVKVLPFTLTAAVSTGQQGGGYGTPFDSLFSRGSSVQRIARSEPITLQVKTIPAEFKGSHWLAAREVRLEENWSADTGELTAGEPVTRTIALIADGVSVGQLPEISPPELTGVRIYPEHPVTHEQGTGEGLLSTSSRKFVFVPESRAAYELPEVELAWWNVVADRMETARLPARTLEVIAEAPATRKPEVIDVPTDTVPAEEEPEEASGSGSKFFDSVVLWSALLLVAAAALWHLFRRKTSSPGSVASSSSPAEVHVKEEVMDEETVWHQFELACQAGDAAEVRDGILMVGSVLWEGQPPVSLDDVARRVGPDLAHALNNLNRQLYSQEKTAWDAGVIRSGLQELWEQTTAKKPEKKAPELRPLHP